MTEFLYESKVAITKPKFDIFVLAFAVLLLMFKSQRILWVRPIPEIIIVVFGIAVCMSIILDIHILVYFIVWLCFFSCSHMKLCAYPT